jgi:DNA-binding response OmpR family regulator
VATSSELEACAASLEELLARVTALVERAGSGKERDDELELIAVERGLASTLRKLRRLTARSAR